MIAFTCSRVFAAVAAISFGTVSVFAAEKPAKKAESTVSYPPRLPDGQESVTDTSPRFLEAPGKVPEGVAVAKTAPTVDFAYFPGQDYPGNPWSAWGDSLAANGKYYAAVGDHLAPGNAFVYEYDPASKKFRQLLDLKKLLQLPEGHYTPGKIHSRLDLGDDGWLYCSTHRGSTRITSDVYHYLGDWIVRCDPASGKSEVVAQGPVPKHCIPCSVLDPKRLIFYGGTAPGSDTDAAGVQFFAYDVRAKKVLYSGPDGPTRYMIFAPSTGRVYYTAGKDNVEKSSSGKETPGSLMRYDPSKGGAPEKIPGKVGIRAATQETRDGIVYTASDGQGGGGATLYAFDTKSERIEALGPAAVGVQTYIASLDTDATGRYLYYVPGAHGSADRDGSPVVQFDVKTRTRKIIAFLHPFYAEKYGCTLKGTYSTALDPAGDKLYITWNANRGSKAWDTVAVTVLHIPESERPQ
jgi:hypothetical protein